MKYFSYFDLEPNFYSLILTKLNLLQHGPLRHCVLLWHEALLDMALIIHLCPEILGSQQKFVLLSVSYKLLKVLVEKKEPNIDQVC